REFLQELLPVPLLRGFQLLVFGEMQLFPHRIDILLVTMIFLPIVRPRAQSVTPAAQRRCNGDNDPSGEVFPSDLSRDRIPHCRTYHFLHRKHRPDVAELRSSFKILEAEGQYKEERYADPDRPKPPRENGARRHQNIIALPNKPLIITVRVSAQAPP